MPPIPVNAPPRPYVRSPYSQDTRGLGSIYARKGDILADSARMRGATSNAFLASLAAAFSQIQAQEAAKQMQAQRLQQEQAELALKAEDQAQRTADRNETIALRKEAAAEKAQLAAERRGDQRAKSIGYGPMAESDVDTVMQSPERSGDVRYIFGPGTAEGPELQPTADQRKMIEAEAAIAKMGGTIGPNGQVVMPPKPDAPGRINVQPAMVNGKRSFVRVHPDGTMTDFAGRPVNAEPIPPQGPQAPRQPIWVIGPNGEFQDLAGVAPPGSKPASNREQGRPVTSGDAEKVTDLDTSLDDVSVLRDSISAQGSTGTVAKLGAKAPNWVTEYTGWGSDAKKKQALIDRVKQVIGKALEGGVLRKEDELKYANILPTIGDPNDLVLSKMSGLDSALRKRKQRHLDSLADAGYDTSRFESRAQVTDKKVTAAPDLSGLKEGYARVIKTGPFAGQEWTMQNGQAVRIK